MTRSHLATCAILAALLAAAPADAGRPRGMQALDTDLLLLPYVEQDNLYRLTVLRSAGGQILLMDQSDASPLRVTPLGFSYPSGSTLGSYTAAPDGHVWAAFSTARGIRVYDLGDVEQPGPLAPVLKQAESLDGFDPRATQMGIIAICIGVVAEPRPGLSISNGTSNTMMLGWDGDSFEPVVAVGDGTWTWERDLQVLDHDAITLQTDTGEMLVRLTTLRAASGRILLMDESAGRAPRITPLDVVLPSGPVWASFAAADDGIVYAVLATKAGGEVISADCAVTGPVTTEHLASISMEGLDPASTQIGIIAILIGVVAEPRPALFSIDIGTSEAVVLGWNGDAFVPVRFDPTRGVYVEEVSAF